MPHGVACTTKFDAHPTDGYAEMCSFVAGDSWCTRKPEHERGRRICPKEKSRQSRGGVVMRFRALPGTASPQNMAASKISDSALPLTLGGDALSLTATSATPHVSEESISMFHLASLAAKTYLASVVVVVVVIVAVVVIVFV